MLFIMGYVKDKLGEDGFKELMDILNYCFEKNGLKKINLEIPNSTHKQSPQTTGKICPMISKACIEEKCTWWDEGMKVCSGMRFNAGGR